MVFARFLVIMAGFILACFAADLVVILAALYPDLSNLHLSPTGRIEFGMLMAFAFIFVSMAAMTPALLLILIAELFAVRSLVFYALGGALVGLAAYAGLMNFDLSQWAQSASRREVEVLIGAGIVAGVVYWLVAGRTAGLWRSAPPPAQP